MVEVGSRVWFHNVIQKIVKFLWFGDLVFYGIFGVFSTSKFPHGNKKRKGYFLNFPPSFHNSKPNFLHLHSKKIEKKILIKNWNSIRYSNIQKFIIVFPQFIGKICLKFSRVCFLKIYPPQNLEQLISIYVILWDFGENINV